MENNKNNFFRFFLSIARLKKYIYTLFPIVRKRLFTFLVFLALATILWLFRALDEPSIANINYPVEFINLPKNKMLTSAPPRHITIRVKANGYTILNNKIISPVLYLDVNNFSFYTQSDGLLKVYLTSKLAREMLTLELNKGKNHLEIIRFSPDTLYFSFAKTMSIKVPIRAKFTDPANLLAKQHMINDNVIVTPDCVQVVGPANIIDTLQYIYTKPIRVNKLKDSTTKKIGIIEYEGTKNAINKVEVLIPVDRYTESKFEVPLTYEHVPDSINIVAFPRSISITFNIAMSNLQKISKSDFHPYIDFYEISGQSMPNKSKLTVHFGPVPAYAQKVAVYPEKVDYLIEYKNVENRNNRGNR